jgi:hypothetical protein
MNKERINFWFDVDLSFIICFFPDQDCILSFFLVTAASSAGMHLPCRYLLAQVILKQGYTTRILKEQVCLSPNVCSRTE